MKLYYWNGQPNAGDYYTAWLFHKMHIPFELVKKDAELIATGSILSHAHVCNNNTKVWGSGYIKRDLPLNPFIKEENIYAVRGTYTYEKLGIKKKVALGDPGLLVSKYYHPNHTHKYKWGIVCHYVDEEYFRKTLSKYNVPIISMATNDVEHVIDQICECDFIFSSSLHGIIFSHSLGIPAIHLENLVLMDDTENFKFRDYYSVLNVPYTKESISDFGPELIDKYLKNSLGYKPTSKRVEEIQEGLLDCFPYHINNKIKPITVNKPITSTKVCICAIAKCENKYINDWVNYHLNSGIDEIHIYDNNDKSYSPVENCIKINSGRVVIHKIPDAKNFQRGVYTKFYKQNKDRFDWIIFIDIDEFINLNNQYPSIKEFLNDKLFYDTNVIRLKWKVFGDGDLITRDINIPVYKGITKPSDNNIFNSQAKCIVRGGLDNVIFESVHYPLINDVVPKQKLPNGKITYGKISINEKSNGICLNHYMTKTISEFIDQKLSRGTDACFPERVIDFDYFWKINNKTADKLNYIKFKGFKI